eukprot:CAMPEP_0185579648 /NCGR_PEP_ID=MMETSP0434-20130131/15330_1 /TAXON_ID=626734 ORGANISM="Favella taraikaensis, Strain Fe Narragansett Bay" /NCGR_SAMPLE_ID=MMETSP0434 /ASSEMBLY_ACC=CAM_ASM_000379 /LENGTH=86 /DNA_ID=CAMNT_0028197713 /DNA_START=492 /DNA_END=752 /DNA_ORIENTATION=-
MTEESKLLFRKGAQHLIKLCQGSGIQMVIVSGGIYELIEHSLRMLETHDDQTHDFGSIKILSNQFEYALDDSVSGYRTPLIHSANK